MCFCLCRSKAVILIHPKFFSENQSLPFIAHIFELEADMPSEATPCTLSLPASKTAQPKMPFPSHLGRSSWASPQRYCCQSENCSQPILSLQAWVGDKPECEPWAFPSCLTQCPHQNARGRISSRQEHLASGGSVSLPIIQASAWGVAQGSI